MDRALFNYKSVVEDLFYLKRTWYNEIDSGELRRGTAILRRLLLEGEYSALWRFLKFEKEPSVICVNLDVVLPLFDSAKIVFAFASGAKIAGIQCSSIVFHEGDECLAYTEEVAESSIVRMSISQYIKSTTAFVEGKKISRREYIQFIANKCGGVHLKKRKEILTDEFKSIKNLEDKVYINFQDAFFHEVQSIGQAVTNSESCELLLQRYGEAVSKQL